MHFLRTVLALLLIAGLQALPAWAYQAGPGTRAANFKGFDLVSRRTIELDDYAGQWVLIEFWATWCGFCMDELPNLLEETRPYVDRGDLAVITVNADTPDALPDVRRAIRKHHLRYPVIYDGGVYSEESSLPILAREWNVFAFPSSFLINPQGVIVATTLRGDKLAATLDYYLNHGDRPLLGVDCCHQVNDDKSVTVRVNVRNTAREDVRVELYTYQNLFHYNAETGEEDVEIVYADELIDSAVVSFTDLCEGSCEFTIPADRDRHYLRLYPMIVVPGTEEITGYNGPGIKFRHRGGYEMFFEVEYIDGEYKVYRDTPPVRE